jgi:hypothetical protein
MILLVLKLSLSSLVEVEIRSSTKDISFRKHGSPHTDEKILLFRSMRLILSLGDEFWPAAIDLMKIHQSQSIEHLELFQLLLSHCFGDIEQYRSRLEALWEFFPEKFTALDLIGIFKAETEKIKARQITQIAEQLNTDEARTYNSLVITNLNSYMTQEKKMKMTLRTHTGLNVGDVKNELFKAFERENNALVE